MKLVDDTDDLRKKVMFRLLAFHRGQERRDFGLKWTDWIDKTFKHKQGHYKGF